MILVAIIVEKFRKCNFELIVLFDGIGEDIKINTKNQRNRRGNDKQTLTLSAINEGVNPLLIDYDTPPGGII
jgi:hypothetical protein